MTQASAVAFDVFGTLCDGYAKQGPYGILRDALGIEKSLFREAAMTRNLSVRELVKELATPEKIAQNLALIEKIEASIAKDCKKVFLFNDAIETMHVLRRFNIPYGLISNLAKPYAAPVIELLGNQGILPPDDLCLWSFSEGLIKPALELFQRFSQRVNKSPDQILMVGDNKQNDFIAARLAGCQSRLLVRAPYAEIEVDSTDIITSLSDIPNIIGLEVGIPRLSERVPGITV